MTSLVKNPIAIQHMRACKKRGKNLESRLHMRAHVVAHAAARRTTYKPVMAAEPHLSSIDVCEAVRVFLEAHGELHEPGDQPR